MKPTEQILTEIKATLVKDVVRAKEYGLSYTPKETICRLLEALEVAVSRLSEESREINHDSISRKWCLKTLKKIKVILNGEDEK